MNHWKTQQLTSTYVDGVRGAIPLANEQIEILLRIIRFFKPSFNLFLDLGCGNGVLGEALFKNWPDSKGIFLDYSEPMIDEAKLKCKDYQNQSIFTVQDFGSKDWLENISDSLPVDVVVSGFSIHHQNDDNKKRIYNQVYDKILKPGGIFLNLDQVASPSKEVEEMFDEYFMGHVKEYHKKADLNTSVEKIADGYYKDKEVNILAPVQNQCNWLKEIGYVNVNCFFKAFELAIFGGIKPK